MRSEDVDWTLVRQDRRRIQELIENLGRTTFALQKALECEKSGNDSERRKAISVAVDSEEFVAAFDTLSSRMDSDLR